MSKTKMNSRAPARVDFLKVRSKSGGIMWNFYKYVVSPDGEHIRCFPTNKTPAELVPPSRSSSPATTESESRRSCRARPSPMGGSRETHRRNLPERRQRSRSIPSSRAKRRRAIDPSVAVSQPESIVAASQEPFVVRSRISVRRLYRIQRARSIPMSTFDDHPRFRSPRVDDERGFHFFSFFAFFSDFFSLSFFSFFAFFGVSASSEALRSSLRRRPYRSPRRTPDPPPRAPPASAMFLRGACPYHAGAPRPAP